MTGPGRSGASGRRLRQAHENTVPAMPVMGRAAARTGSGDLKPGRQAMRGCKSAARSAAGGARFLPHGLAGAVNRARTVLGGAHFAIAMSAAQAPRDTLSNTKPGGEAAEGSRPGFPDVDRNKINHFVPFQPLMAR